MRSRNVGDGKRGCHWEPKTHCQRKKARRQEAKATLVVFKIMAGSGLIEMWALWYKVGVYWPC